MEHHDVLIVGAGHGGAQAAIALRQRGFDGSIGLLGDEPSLPYERPPLSKDYLAGVKPFARLLIRPEGFWAERRITLLPGRTIVSVDPAARRVVDQGGGAIGYGDLVWATGGRPRALACAGGNLAGVHAIRTRADVDRLAAELPSVARAVVIGGGYIGLEAAAVLTGLGKAVTLLEAQPRVLARVAAEPLSRFYEAEHRARGVDLRLEAAVACIEGEGRATGVRLADGALLPADVVIVGIGITPAVEPLLAAGATGAAGGVLVDEQCRTDLPHVFAVGDGAAQANAFADNRVVRVESVGNATDQAAAAAKAITGAAPEPYRATPWFWSDQYDLKLQTVGLSSPGDAVVLRGDPAARRFSLVYLRDGRVAALDCVNAVRDYAQGRALVDRGAIIDPARLADPETPLKSLILS